MTNKICIIDYGSENYKSLFNLINYLGYKVFFRLKNDIRNTSYLLPGFGSCADLMLKIKYLNIKDINTEYVFIKKNYKF